MATPHYRQETKTGDISLVHLNKIDLVHLCKNLLNHLKELENLVSVISQGKYTWEATFDAISEPVMIINRDFTVERANLAVAKVSSVAITEVPGKKCFEIFAGRQTPCTNCPLQKTLDSGEQKNNPLGNKIFSKNFHAYAYPFFNDNGELHSAVLYYRNITEELRLKQELIQQEKMAAIGMLAGGVAHEINNPLGGILAFTQLLLRKTKEGTETFEDLNEIQQAATRCKKIVQDLLDFSRISKDRERCLVDVNSLIEKVLPLTKMEIRSLNVDLQCLLEPNLPSVMVVPNRLQQVFLNLMTNACQAMPHGGRLTIRTKCSKEKEVCISIEDTGIGMSKEVQSRIFEPFFTTKELGKGTGLGLAISYRIVKENEGRLEIESEEGKGSNFTVRLPAAN